MATRQHHHATVSEKKKEDWMNSKWRPMMGWMYMAVCTCDFMIFPILWSLLQSLSHGTVQTQWQPLTLQGAGLFHIAMGAVLGIAAYGRTQEKLGGANNGGIQMPSNAGTTYIPPGQGTVNVNNQPGMNAGFGSTNSFGSLPMNTGFGSSTGFTTPVAAPITTGYQGKKAPPDPVFPSI
jgi:Holin of 3TMs, for gene-transfer release